MIIKKHGGAWWIEETPTPDVSYYGPYETEAEAEDDMRGIARCIVGNRRIFKEVDHAGD